MRKSTEGLASCRLIKAEDMEDKDMIGAVEGYTMTNVFPLLGNALAARDTVRNEQAHRFIQDVLVEVNLKLWKLEQRVDKEYRKTEDFLNFFHKTLLKAAVDLRREKMRMFANIIVNSTLKGNADSQDGKKYLFDETIDKIDERLFEFLLRMSSRRMLDDNTLNKGCKGDDDDLKVLGIDEKKFFFNADYLLSVGVLVRLPRFNLEDEGALVYHDEYFVTQYGVDFVEYVRDQDMTEDAAAEEVTMT